MRTLLNLTIKNAKDGNFSFDRWQMDKLLGVMGKDGKDGAAGFARLLVEALRKYRVEILPATQLTSDEIKHYLGILESQLPMIAKRSDWCFQENGEHVIVTDTKALLLRTPPQSLSFGIHFNGAVRYRHRIQCHKPSLAEQWNTDTTLEKVIRKMLEQEDRKRLSYSDVRTRLKLGNFYYSAFPVSVVMYFIRWVARQRPSGRIGRYLDPCAGWGDRLAGAMLSGEYMDHYVGFDPWPVSNRLCRSIEKQLRPHSKVTVDVRHGPCEVGPAWPEADLVFTSPPYGSTEHYDCDGTGTGQAWKLIEFFADFLQPMMHRAALSTKTRDGWVMINVANSASCTDLTHQVKRAAEDAGLVQVSLFGLHVPTRPNQVVPAPKAEPCFVFRHPRTDD